MQRPEVMLERSQRSLHRESNHIGAAAFDRFDEQLTAFLQRVGPRLVHHLDCFRVFFDDTVVIDAESHACDLMEFSLPPWFHLREMNARRDLVHASGQSPEHPLCICFVTRLSQRATFQPDEGIRAEDHSVRMTCRDFECLGPGIGGDQSGQVQRRIVDLQSRGGIGQKIQSRGLQQFLPSRRRGGKDKRTEAQ